MKELEGFSGDEFWKVIFGLMQTPAEFNATCARTAMEDGEKSTLIRVIIPLSSQELKALKVAYKNSKLILCDTSCYTAAYKLNMLIVCDSSKYRFYLREYKTINTTLNHSFIYSGMEEPIGHYHCNLISTFCNDVLKPNPFWCFSLEGNHTLVVSKF